MREKWQKQMPLMAHIKDHPQSKELEAISTIINATPTICARRAAAMVSRVALKGPIIFTGGVALNNCLVQLLSQILKTPVLVPDDPQIVGALGAALLARERGRQNAKSPGSPTGPS